MPEKKVGPEIVFGVVGAVGADLEFVSKGIREALDAVNYQCETIQISALMHDLPAGPWNNLPVSPEYKRIDAHMTAGNKFRTVLNRGDALALLAVGTIREGRQQKGGSPVDTK